MLLLNDELENHFDIYSDSNFLELLKVNLKLWKVEDEIRDMEKNNIFDLNYIKVARSVYILNDKRAEIKKSINSLLDSNLREEKSYLDFDYFKNMEKKSELNDLTYKYLEELEELTLKDIEKISLS